MAAVYRSTVDSLAPITVTITVGADSTIQSMAATWSGGSTWIYKLTFTELGSAPELTAPTNAQTPTPTP